MAAPEHRPGEMVDLTDFAGSLFHGPAAHLASRFEAAPAVQGDISCIRMLDPKGLTDILETYRSGKLPTSDRRAIASFWSQWYFGFLIPPLLMLSQAAGTRVPANPGRLTFRHDGKGQPFSFKLIQPSAITSEPDDSPFDLMSELIDNHLSPLVFSLAARSGASAKVFWMNAAVAIDYTCDVLLDGKAPAFKAVTQAPARPNGGRNPLFGPYRPSGSELTRTRRVCCLRYLLEGVDRCPDCSLMPASGKTERPVVPGAGRTD
ncbi:siderophore-iron reductase FhuF [Roseibium litorale]|uniref:Siderophore-iron reductase FhuF n=1 Tax=Roseibium litorale TaxID=2803841 RepID=A0ABR9CLB8_9HYPH|nr:siderophore-iron reductase FhuF [Roseibium litorale]MBD8891117.1 siderophore-iron reductase FhuF [Roseibium litorale]